MQRDPPIGLDSTTVDEIGFPVHEADSDGLWDLSQSRLHDAPSTRRTYSESCSSKLASSRAIVEGMFSTASGFCSTTADVPDAEMSDSSTEPRALRRQPS